ncbi:MAG: glycosyltransferase [Candidatus Methanomethylicia archaeon]
MKIIEISTSVMPLPPRSYAGLELLVYELSVELAKRGHQVYLIAPIGSQKPKNLDNLHLIQTIKPSWNNPEREAFMVYKDIINKLIDSETIVHDHTWSMYPYLFKIANPKIKICHTFHGPNTFRLPQDKDVIEQIKAGDWNLIGVSYAHSKYLSEAMGNIPINTIYNGVDENMYPFYEGNREDYVLYFGLINNMKGADTFVDIISRTNYKAVMAGEDTFISDLNFVNNLINYISKETNIDYYGSVSFEFKKWLMQHAKLMVYPFNPFWMEAFNLAYVEASMIGTPVLVSEVGSMRELTQDLPDLYKAKPNNRILREDLPKIMEDLDQNFELRSKQFHDNAMKFTLEKMVDNYEKFFEKML